MGKLCAKYLLVSVQRLLWYTVHNCIMADYCGLIWGLISGRVRDLILFTKTRSIRLVWG